MAKYYGKVGYIETVETVPGNWTEKVTELPYYGDVIRKGRQWVTNTESSNDNLNISNSISIIADPYAYEHFYAIKYCEWAGVLWKVTDIQVEYPRLILSIGDVYNGKTAETA